MSDILDDLRDPEGRGPMQHCRAWTELDALQDRAAAEIVRIRSCRDDLVAALEAIAQGANESSGTGEMAFLDTIYAMHALARAALKRAREE
jgi:hypothetical protein